LPVLLNEWCTFLRILHQHFITNTAANTVAGSCLQLHGNLIVTCTKCAQYEKAVTLPGCSRVLTREMINSNAKR